MAFGPAIGSTAAGIVIEFVVSFVLSLCKPALMAYDGNC